MKIKVLMIDPWGTDSLGPYIKGICCGLADKVHLTLITNHYYEVIPEARFEQRRLFFRRSEHMGIGRKRKVLRGIEYIAAYIKIFCQVKKERYDVVHIQWLLFYPLDLLLLKCLKKHAGSLILTAHNVIPHIEGEHYVPILNKIYSYFDYIIIHGNNMKGEFQQYFPQFSRKLYIQRFGFDAGKFPDFHREQVSPDILSVAEQACGKKVFIIFGNQFYNKGTDRILRIYADHSERLKDTFLILAGKNSEKYEELHRYGEMMRRASNIAMFNYYLPESDLNFLIQLSHVILIPYRHASVSGLVFQAAKHGKTVLLTRTGSLEEYVKGGENAFLVENSDAALERGLLNIAESVPADRLEEMGENLSRYIIKTCSWDAIGSGILNDCYRKAGQR